MNIKRLRQFVECNLKASINFREKTRGCGVYLAENISFYYMTIGEISTLQRIGGLIGVDKKLLDYDPYETEEDDQKFNYCASVGEIGEKENK